MWMMRFKQHNTTVHVTAKVFKHGLHSMMWTACLFIISWRIVHDLGIVSRRPKLVLEHAEDYAKKKKILLL